MFSLIIPMYNEEKILPDTIETLHAYMESAFDDYEIVFADDGSTDRSRKIVEECGHERMRVVGYEKNRGKGCAVRCGMLAARGDIRLFTDCDLAYGTEIIRTLYDKFTAAGCDVMIGSRNLSGDGYEGYTALRRIVSKTYIRVLCTIGGFKLSDSQCGFKAFSAKAAEDVFSRCETDGFAFDFEAILFATKLGYKIAELPVKIINHRESKVDVLSDSIRMLRDLLQIKKHVKEQLK
ncbi:MAG: glycosyltransferase [Clostridia bacterium]|nr:glycosyltransferase [Clostridia bacterium]